MARLKVSVVSDSGARIGPGKLKLLEAVLASGSISAAARDMGMSYKRAWVLLDSINQAFEEPVIAGAPGGKHGGGATLTPFGVTLLYRVRRIETAAMAAVRRDVASLESRARKNVGPRV